MTTDLDTFRAALHGGDDGLPPALDDIMDAGRKLRVKRRLASVTVAAAALVITVGATATVWRAQAPPAVPAAAAPQAVRWPAPTGPVTPDSMWGEPADTGMRSGGNKIVVTAFHNDNPAYPDITFGVRACVQAAGAELRNCHQNFDNEAPDNTPGFHAIGMTSSDGKTALPMYGYYVGPAATITVRSRGEVVTAHTATWSEDANVVLFWFTLDDVFLKPDVNHPNYKLHKYTPGESPDVSGWTAYDDSGAVLPVGKPFVIG
ncbi:hypothetical protein [Actinoplanes sp. NPDC051494]|uniref:hypothetical protein n=1 Tax=Actinoplanes sp. NPDC051494 TaxID=3363907 RepID=UPI0037B04F6C